MVVVQDSVRNSGGGRRQRAGCPGLDAVGRTLFRFPEALGVVVAVLLLLGRYTGYRVTELYRFRDVIVPEAKHEPVIEVYRVRETSELAAKSDSGDEKPQPEEPKHDTPVLVAAQSVAAGSPGL